MRPEIQVEFRHLRPEDEPALLSLRNEVNNLAFFRNPLPVSQQDHASWFHSRLCSPSKLEIVAAVSGQLIGIAYLSLSVDNSATVSINVLPKFQSFGIGKALLTRVIQKAQKSGFCIIDAYIHNENIPSVALFEKLGFTQQTSINDGFKLFTLRIS